MDYNEAISRMEGYWYQILSGVSTPHSVEFNPDLSVQGAMSRSGCKAGESISTGPPWSYHHAAFFEFDPELESTLNSRLEQMANEGWTVKRRLDVEAANPKWILVRDDFAINFTSPSAMEREQSLSSGKSPYNMKLTVISPCAEGGPE